MGIISKSIENAREAAGLISSKKAEDIIVYDTRELTFFTDFIIIATVNSSSQLEAVTAHLKENFEVKPDHIEGGAGGWTLVDYGSFVINLFLPEKREFYALERIWGDARKVRF